MKRITLVLATISSVLLTTTLFACTIGVARIIANWTKPIVVGRHAHADQYRATDIKIPGKGTLKMVFTPEGGAPQEWEVNKF
jgi:isocitrate dehydrogenase